MTEQDDDSSSLEKEKSSWSGATSYGTFDEDRDSKRNVQYYLYYSFPPFSQAEETIEVLHDQIFIRSQQRSRQTLAVYLCHLASMMILFGSIMLVILCRNMAKGDGGIAGMKSGLPS